MMNQMIPCCANRKKGQAQRFTSAVPLSDESADLPPAHNFHLPAVGEFSSRDSSRRSSHDRDSAGKGSGRESVGTRLARRLGMRSSRRSRDRDGTRSFSSRRGPFSSRRGETPRGDEGTAAAADAAPPRIEAVAFHNALISGWLDCALVPSGQNQLPEGDAPPPPKPKRFNRRWAAVWHDRVAWYDGGREAASLPLTHATVVAAVEGNGACLACLCGERGVFLSLSDEAEAELWAGHIRSATATLLTEHERLEREKVQLGAHTPTRARRHVGKTARMRIPHIYSMGVAARRS